MSQTITEVTPDVTSTGVQGAVRHANDDKDAKRPPTRLTSAHTAAAIRLGMQSAGLTWIQQANAADAATSHAPPPPSGARAPPCEEPGRALIDVPMIGEPPRYEREVVLPVPDGFIWPEFPFIAFYEHSGEEREANARILDGAPTCSVADRRSILPPSEHSWHFIGPVQDFLCAYPHPVRRQSNHVPCGAANWASWHTWTKKILDGSMLRSAEEFLWINCIGDRSLGEQPPTAHQHTIGPPTYTVNGHDFGAPSKTYCKWARNLPPVTPSATLPYEQRWSELMVTGSAETKMVLRSYTPRNLASEEARIHAAVSGGDTSEFGRPAAQPCNGYPIWRRQLLHNFGLFAAHYAPTMSTAWLHQTARDAALIMVPIAHHPSVGACAMINLREPQVLFGAALDARRTGADQGAEVAAFISRGLETVYAAPVKCFGHPDSVVMVPWDTPPAHVLTSPSQRTEAAAAGLSAAWCTLAALHNHIAYIPVGAAFLRVAALTTTGAHGAQVAGTWTAPRPMVRMRTAHALTTLEAPPAPALGLEQQRAMFFAQEAERGDELRALLVAADHGSGELIAMATRVRTAADFQSEIPFPIYGLPDFSSSSLRLLPFVERPLNLHTSWLARLPPQQVPPGFKPRPWKGILRGWARRACSKALNQTADRDFECYNTGTSTRRRPEYICIGPGGGMEIAHLDGIGSYNALSIVWELDPTTGLYDKLDFERPGRTHWTLNVLRQLMGEHEDHQLMSLIMQGVRWGVKAPMQIRIAANLERLDQRARGVGEAFAKLLKKGLYYKYKKLRRADERIDPEGPGPFIIIPTYIVGTGGTDKPDNPNEKRIVGDQGMPHPEQALRERNRPHGTPDGPLIVSMNDMMGPEPGTQRGTRLDPARYPMPDPETKPRPRHSYRNGAILSHMALVNNTYKAGFKDDGRHMFFQFEQSPEEERTCAFVVVVPFPIENDDGSPMLDDDGKPRFELWFVLIIATCMNMGSRNASKIAQRFTDRLLEGFSKLLDVYVRDAWLPRQSPELRALLAERAAKLGPQQARPFDTCGYSDDFKFEFVGPELLAAGALIWRTACGKANFWLSEKAGVGTVLDYIGGRLILNGGFGCISPSKRARAIADSMAAIDGRLTREQLEAHNSFLVHVHEWLDFPMGTLKGLSAPLKIPGAPEQHAALSEKVRAQHHRIIALLQTRNAASFWSGIDEAARLGDAESGAGLEAIIFAPRITSDACSDVENPYICGVCNGLFFRFPLEGAWRQRHITLTEACGTILALTIFAGYFPNDELLVESDATASLATAAALAAADDLIYARRRAEHIKAFQEATRRAWLLHCKGCGPTRSRTQARGTRWQ